MCFSKVQEALRGMRAMSRNKAETRQHPELSPASAQVIDHIIEVSILFSIIPI